MTNEAKRDYLMDQLQNCKKEGLRCFISKSDKNDPSCYGIISDNKNIIYVQLDEYGRKMLRPSFEYVPKTSTGSGCFVLEEGMGFGNFNKEIFEYCVIKGKMKARDFHAELYRNLDHYFKDKWKKENLIEL